MTVDWRRREGSPYLSDRQIAEIPKVLRDLADAIESLTRRLPPSDVCLWVIDVHQICGVRRESHDEFSGDHPWTP